MLGIGGGIVFVPLLFDYLTKKGIEDPLLTQLVIANSISLTLFSTFTSFVNRRRELGGHWRQPIMMGLSASLLSILSFQFIVLQGFVNKQLLALLLMITIVYTMIRNLVKREGHIIGKKNLSDVSIASSTIIGSCSGFFASLSGLGGGVIIVPVLSEVCKINLRLSQTVSLVVVSISSLLLTLSNLVSYNHGFIWHPELYQTEIVFPIVIGILIGTPIGNWLYPRIPLKFNKLLFIGVLTYIAYINLKMLFL